MELEIKLAVTHGEVTETKLFLSLNVDYMGIFILKKFLKHKEEFQSSQNTPDGTIMMDTCHHRLSTSTEHTQEWRAVRLGMTLRVSAGSPIGGD